MPLLLIQFMGLPWTTDNSVGTSALPFLQHPASNSSHALRATKAASMCSVWRVGTGRALPTRSKELILSPQAAPSPPSQELFPNDPSTYTQSPILMELQKTSCSSQLLLWAVPHSSLPLVLLMCHFTRNWAPQQHWLNSSLLQLRGRTPCLQLYPHSQWNRKSLKGVGLADSLAVKHYRKFSLLKGEYKMPCL